TDSGQLSARRPRSLGAERSTNATQTFPTRAGAVVVLAQVWRIPELRSTQDLLGPDRWVGDSESLPELGLPRPVQPRHRGLGTAWLLGTVEQPLPNPGALPVGVRLHDAVTGFV